MFRVPFSDAALDVRMERVEVPLPIWPPLLPQKIQGESQSPIVPVPQRRDEIEADEEIIVVMDRVVEPVPRWVLSTLLVQFLYYYDSTRPRVRRRFSCPPSISLSDTPRRRSCPPTSPSSDRSRNNSSRHSCPDSSRATRTHCGRRDGPRNRIAPGRAWRSRSCIGGLYWNLPSRILRPPGRIVQSRYRTPS